LRDRGFAVQLVGDAFAPRAMLAAVHEAHRVASAV
jgi:hypothetical protein